MDFLPLGRSEMLGNVVLSVGSDRMLLKVRDDVLRAAGYIVREYLPSQFTSVENDFDVAVLCHSIPADEQRRIIRYIRSHKPTAPILLVRSDGETSDVDATVHGLDGPQALLDCVGHLLQKAAS